MMGNTRRVLAGTVISTAVLLLIGPPALAVDDGSEHAPQTSHPGEPGSAGTVDIGTAQAWIRRPDGTIQRVR
jgi:hypothetical protein